MIALDRSPRLCQYCQFVSVEISVLTASIGADKRCQKAICYVAALGFLCFNFAYCLRSIGSKQGCCEKGRRLLGEVVWKVGQYLVCAIYGDARARNQTRFGALRVGRISRATAPKAVAYWSP
jgi:hypothetical protein